MVGATVLALVTLFICLVLGGMVGAIVGLALYRRRMDDHLCETEWHDPHPDRVRYHDDPPGPWPW